MAIGPAGELIRVNEERGEQARPQIVEALEGGPGAVRHRRRGLRPDLDLDRRRTQPGLSPEARRIAQARAAGRPLSR